MGKKTLAERIEKWTDEEVLTNLSAFFERIAIDVRFMENDEGLITHQMLAIACGDKVLGSEFKELDWPLQRLPMPEAFRGRLN